MYHLGISVKHNKYDLLRVYIYIALSSSNYLMTYFMFLFVSSRRPQAPLGWRILSNMMTNRFIHVSFLVIPENIIKTCENCATVMLVYIETYRYPKSFDKIAGSNIPQQHCCFLWRILGCLAFSNSVHIPCT